MEGGLSSSAVWEGTSGLEADPCCRQFVSWPDALCCMFFFCFLLATNSKVKISGVRKKRNAYKKHTSLALLFCFLENNACQKHHERIHYFIKTILKAIANNTKWEISDFYGHNYCLLQKMRSNYVFAHICVCVCSFGRSKISLLIDNGMKCAERNHWIYWIVCKVNTI